VWWLTPLGPAHIHSNVTAVSPSGAGLSPDPGGDPHPVDHQAPVLQDLQAPRDLQADGEGVCVCVCVCVCV